MEPWIHGTPLRIHPTEIIKNISCGPLGRGLWGWASDFIDFRKKKETWVAWEPLGQG